MKTLAAIFAALLLVGCSSLGPWKVPHPEEVANSCGGQELEITATTRGSPKSYNHSLKTVCGKEDNVSSSQTSDRGSKKLQTKEVQYKKTNPDGKLGISERATTGVDSYSHEYQRKSEDRVSKKTKVRTGIYFGIYFGPKAR